MMERWLAYLPAQGWCRQRPDIAQLRVCCSKLIDELPLGDAARARVATRHQRRPPREQLRGIARLALLRRFVSLWNAERAGGMDRGVRNK